mmetsp:Transcript_90124/g.143506  ORF Transcript_90124/g.143506 Transcript_90124/m.143506 type:complete len:222 (+) Transcript_90124:1062-1727(+)
MRAILLRLLGHESHVGASSHGLWIEGPVLLAKLDALTEHTRIGAIWNGRLEVLLSIICIPHLSTGPDGRGHGVVDDDIAGDVQVSDALVGIHHGHARLRVIGGLDVRLNGLTLRVRQSGDLLIEVTKAVVGVHTNLVEGLGILREDILEIGLHAVAEHDWVRHLHHGCFQMQGEHHASLLSVGDLLFKEATQHFAVDEGRVQDLILLQGELVFQNRDLAIL